MLAWGKRAKEPKPTGPQSPEYEWQDMGMKAGYQGTFVISWAQTDVDGLSAAPLDAISVGAAWRYSGDAVQVDGARDLLILTGPAGEA
jgi:hypothetical protein